MDPPTCTDVARSVRTTAAVVVEALPPGEEPELPPLTLGDTAATPPATAPPTRALATTAMTTIRLTETSPTAARPTGAGRSHPVELDSARWRTRARAGHVNASFLHAHLRGVVERG